MDIAGWVAMTLAILAILTSKLWHAGRHIAADAP